MLFYSISFVYSQCHHINNVAFMLPTDMAYTVYILYSSFGCNVQSLLLLLLS